MNTRKSYVWGIFFLSVMVAGALVLNKCMNGTDEPIIRNKEREIGKERPSHAVAEKKILDRVRDAYKNPISLYGKVIDQNGMPVSNATIKLYPLTSHFGEEAGREIVLTSDADGAFSITGLQGFSMGVSVRKAGYLSYPPTSGSSSEVSLSYSEDGDGRRHAVPENPLVLELRKIGPSEPTFYVDQKRWKLPLDGTPRMIALDSEEGQGAHQIEFRFKSDWHKLPMDNEINLKLFDWSFEIRVPGGGLVWDRSDANFEAPEYGYKEWIRYEYSAIMPPKDWQRTRKGRYFVKFADGTYGRIQFSIDGGSDRSPLYMQSWLCLKPGSRNLGVGNMIIKVMDSEEPQQ